MLRKSLTFIAVLALSTTLSLIRITAQQSAVQPSGAGELNSSLQYQPNTASQRQSRQANQQGTNNATATQEEKNAEPLTPEARISVDNLNIQRQIATFTRYIVITGAVVGGLQVVLMVMTWFVTNKAAEAAKSSATTARDSLMSVQRAFVAKSGNNVRFSAYGPNGAQRMAMLTAILTNSGTTPAVDVVYYVDVILSETEPIEVVGPMNQGPKPITYIPPHGSINATIERPELEVFETSPAERVESTISWKRGAHLFGWVAYRDIFGNPHVTQFCDVLRKKVRENRGTQHERLRFDWVQSQAHNGVDETAPNFDAIVKFLPPRKKQTAN